jgi:excisionase family DNA binding protein
VALSGMDRVAPSLDSDGSAARLAAPARHADRASSPFAGSGAGLTPRLVTILVAARLLGVGRSTVYQLIAVGEIEVVHIGRSARVPISSLDAFVAQLRGRD